MLLWHGEKDKHCISVFVWGRGEGVWCIPSLQWTYKYRPREDLILPIDNARALWERAKASDWKRCSCQLAEQINTFCWRLWACQALSWRFTTVVMCQFTKALWTALRLTICLITLSRFKRLGMPGLDPTKPYLEKWLSFVAGCCLSAWGAWVDQMWSEVTHIGLSHLSLAFSSRFSQPDWSTVRAALASSVLLDSHCDCPSICLDKAHSPKQARTRGEGHRDRFTGHICKHSWNHCAVECKAHSKWRLSKLYRKVGPRRLYL